MRKKKPGEKGGKSFLKGKSKSYVQGGRSNGGRERGPMAGVRTLRPRKLKTNLEFVHRKWRRSAEGKKVKIGVLAEKWFRAGLGTTICGVRRVDGKRHSDQKKKRGKRVKR